MVIEAYGKGQKRGDGLVVALDGPASSGKSSVGAAAAKELGYRFCDTGLLYRAVTWLALHRDIAAAEGSALVGLVEEIDLIDDGSGRLAHVAVDGVDRTAEVRGPDVDVAVSGYSGVAELRLALLARQRRLASEGRIIMAGRDIGTVVLPDADLKLYLDASVEERARRRVLERGIDPESAEATEILNELRRRDLLDSTREVAPLRAADDAVILRTDGNAFEETVRLVADTIRNSETAVAAPPTGPEASEAVAAAAAGSAEPPGASATPGQRDAVHTDDAKSAIDAKSAVDAVDATSPRSVRTPRAPRRPIVQTPVASRINLIIGVTAGLFRMIVRAIVRFRIEGDLDALPKGPMIVAANHASSADPVLIGAFLTKRLGRPLNWLGKRELVEFPVTGWLMRHGGIHPVDREAADLEAIRAAMRVLDAGQVLAIFPEGTRSRDGALQQVREGAGMLALRSGAQVLPVAVIDSDRMWPRGRLLPFFGKRVTVRYGAPFTVAEELASLGVPPRGRKATEAATRLIMTRIAALLPPRQRGVYAADAHLASVATAEEAPASAGAGGDGD